MRVNALGHPIDEQHLFLLWVDAPVTHEEIKQAIGLLCIYLDLHIVRTNATPFGKTELVLRENE